MIDSEGMFIIEISRPKGGIASDSIIIDFASAPPMHLESSIPIPKRRPKSKLVM